MSPPDFRTLEFARPDWVMVGMPAPRAGVWLAASKELTSAELKADVERALLRDEFADFDLPFPGPAIRADYTLTAVMRQWVLIEAPDYPAAFRALFEKWAPEPRARPQLGPGPRELT
jgi:hypothetical protein